MCVNVHCLHFVIHLFIDLVSLHFDNKYRTNMKLDLFCACLCKIIGVDSSTRGAHLVHWLT